MTDKNCAFSVNTLGIQNTTFYNRGVRCLLSSCEPGFYLCKREAYCISIELFCDGINHCILGDDEVNCGKRKNKPTNNE